MTRRTSARALARDIYGAMAPPSPDGCLLRRSSRFGCEGRIGGQGPAAQSLTAPSLTEKARALYENSAVPVAEIARLCGVTERTIYKYAAKENRTPRYCWSADGGRPRGAQWRAPGHAAPVRGAAGRFVRRAEAGKPVAAGLQAADPRAAGEAGAACDRAAMLARLARFSAEAAQRDEARLRALETMNLAMAELNRYRAARIKAGKPPLHDADRLAQLLVRTVEIATAHVERLLP